MGMLSDVVGEMEKTSREDVEVIIDGSGLMFGDYEAITMVRVLGIDETPPYNENKSLFFSLMSFILNSQFFIYHTPQLEGDSLNSLF